MVRQFKKAYFHRPIKILDFLTPAIIQKCLTYLQNILAFLTINHLQAASLQVIPVCIIVPWRSEIRRASRVFCNRTQKIYLHNFCNDRVTML